MSNTTEEKDYSVISSYDDEKDDCRSLMEKSRKTKTRLACILFLFVAGMVNLVLGMLSVRYNYLELAMNERIKLRPGLPPYEKWKNPNFPIAVKIYLFAVENPDEFLRNTEAKLKLKEIGPITYLKTVKQNDIVFNDDSTLTFTTTQTIEYPEHLNEPGILNRTITIVNPILLGIAAKIHDQYFFRFGFDLLAAKDNVFLNRTVHDILWNLTSPILDYMKQVPFVVPRPNAGILFNSFYPTVSRYNVNIGPKHGFEKFFQINTLNGESRIPVYDSSYPESCPFNLKGTSEGTGLPPFITKQTVLTAYQNNLCRTYPMVFNKELRDKSLDLYEFRFRDDIYKRSNDSSRDCLRKTGGVLLPDGLIDTSKCAFGMPVAFSNPHFYGFDGVWNNYIDGMAPNEEKHSSYFIVEPKTGIQIKAAARIQSNMPIPKLQYTSSKICRFSNMIIPNFWIEQSMEFDDPLIIALVQLLVNYVPVLQPIIVVILLTLSIVCMFKAVLLMTMSRLNIFQWTKTKPKDIVYPTMLISGDR